MSEFQLLGFRKRLIALLIFVWLVCGLLIVGACSRKPATGTAGNGVSGNYDPAYKSKVEIVRLGLAKGENYLGDSVHFVEGEIKNNGERIIQRIDLTLTFRDSLNQIVLKETRHALDYKTSKGLDPQKSAKFQVGFDHLPKDWNYMMPEVEISGVVLR
jgi:hypothetical protein